MPIACYKEVTAGMQREESFEWACDRSQSFETREQGREGSAAGEGEGKRGEVECLGMERREMDQVFTQSEGVSG